MKRTNEGREGGRRDGADGRVEKEGDKEYRDEEEGVEKGGDEKEGDEKEGDETRGRSKKRREKRDERGGGETTKER